MKKNCSYRKSMGVALGILLITVMGNLGFAEIITAPPWESAAVDLANPAPFTWHSSIAYYRNKLIYPGNDGRVYAFDLSAKNSSVVCDTSSLSTVWTSVTGFLVSDDDYLYFHDNGNTSNIYRVLLSNEWPANYEFLDTQCNGSIFSFTQNPWTNAVWFASANFGAGYMYLYEVDLAFTSATERASFAQPHGGGNGPIIFKDATTLLYGESVWGGNGYFHIMDSATGDITIPDYLSFTSGLAGAAYGYDNKIYISSGAGKCIYEINSASMTEVATTDEDAQSIAFDGTSFYVSEQKSSDLSGAISFHRLWRQITESSDSDEGGAAGCFIGAAFLKCWF